MKLISNSDAGCVLRFERGEAYPGALKSFAKKKKIKGGFFFGLGALTDPEISFYDQSKKRYLKHKLKGVFEVLSLVGNVSISKREILVHNHVVLGDRRYKTLGGHLDKGFVGGTLEIFFMRTGVLKRNFDKRTGLNLLL